MFTNYEAIYPGYGQLNPGRKELVRNVVRNIERVYGELGANKAPLSSCTMSWNRLREAIDVCAKEKFLRNYEDIFGKDKKQYNVRARGFIIAACCNMFQQTLSEWEVFFNKDHSTLIYTINKVRDEREIYPETNMEYLEVYSYINKYLIEKGYHVDGRKEKLI